jgi:YbbR domain-containing protein
VTVLRFLVRNWPLKLGAIALAIMMYVAMIALQSTQPWPGQIAIEPIHQPSEAVLIGPDPWPRVSNIRYVAPADVRLTNASFSATVDLANAKVSESETSLVQVQLVADDSRVQIIDYEPRQIRVSLDPLVHKQVPVQVDYGPVPSGLTVGTPRPSVNQVDVFGASSLVKRVSYAEAQVLIESSGLDVDKDVDLVARDARKEIVDGVEFNPPSVHVNLQVGSQLRTQSVPVSPVISDSPATGYYITSVEVTPSVVSVRGDADALQLLAGLAKTVPVSIDGAASDVSVRVALDLPPGVDAPGVTTVLVVVHLQSPGSSRTFTIGVVPDGARADRGYALSTSNVIITLGGSTAALDALDTSTLYAVVSVGGLDMGVHSVKVTVTVPPGIKLLAVNPGEIYVTVGVAPTPGPSPSASPSAGP